MLKAFRVYLKDMVKTQSEKSPSKSEKNIRDHYKPPTKQTEHDLKAGTSPLYFTSENSFSDIVMFMQASSA